MKMRIVSQNKLDDVPYEEVVIGAQLSNQGYDLYAYMSFNLKIYLGTYEKRARALEIMDQIRKRYNELCNIELSDAYRCSPWAENVVFYMPEK